MRHRQAAAGLIQQLLTVNRDKNAVTFLGGSLGDVAKADRLASAGWQYR
jgi:hypothetical protein